MHINRKIEHFLRRHGMAPTTFGRRVARDPRLVLDMRNGRCLRTPMVLRAEAFIAAHEHHLDLLQMQEAA